MTLNNVNKDWLFFADSPQLKNLCVLDIILPQDSSNMTNIQPQIIKCRELIFTEPDIIATPLLCREKKVQIILQISLYKTGRLQSRLEKMGVTVEKPKRVTAADFQSCLRYTLLARIAPLWNKVGDYLIQGRDFVSSTQKTNSVRVEVTATESQLYFSLNAKLTRNPPITLESLSICPNAVGAFQSAQYDDASIPECAIENNWCSVLPSMKKGEIVSVRKCLPKDGLFHSYKDVKKYWKNMYGYRLPENDDGILYFQVYFKMIGPQLFTYPQVCLRSRDFMTYNCPDVASVLQQFICDVQTKMAVVCGTKLHIRTRPMYLHSGLSSVQQIEDTQACNVTTQSVLDKSQYRTQQSAQQNVHNPKRVNDAKSQALTTSNENNTKVLLLAPSKGCEMQYPRNERAGVGSSTHKTYNSVASNSTLSQTQQNSYMKPGTGNRIVPIFKPKPKSCVRINLLSETKNAQPRSVPMFKSLQRNSQHKNPALLSSRPTMFSNLPKIKTDLEKPDTGGKHSTTEISHNVATHFTVGSKSNSQIMKPVFGINRATKGENITYSRTLSKPRICSTECHREAGCVSDVRTLGAEQTPVLSTPAVKVATPRKANPTGVKRESKEEECGVKVKKPRSKPVVQEGVDITQLAANNQLNKLNTVTLGAWLKQRGLPCKAKDKKQYLIARIMAALQINEQ